MTSFLDTGWKYYVENIIIIIILTMHQHYNAITWIIHSHYIVDARSSIYFINALAALHVNCFLFRQLVRSVLFCSCSISCYKQHLCMHFSKLKMDAGSFATFFFLARSQLIYIFASAQKGISTKFYLHSVASLFAFISD